eukprot:711009-Pleurochrysis_carterae.AAC.1
MPMPYKSIPAGGELCDNGEEVFHSEEYYELGEWVIPRHAADVKMVERFDEDVRKIFLDPIMRKVVLDPLGKVILRERRDEK